MSFVVRPTRRFSVLDRVARLEPLRPEEGDAALYVRLVTLFEARAVAFEALVHEPTLTSEASVEARRRLGWTETTLACGAKAMLMRRTKAKAGEATFALCVLAADRRLDYKKLRKGVAKDLTLATEAEVWAAARCLPGAVPPFGSYFFAEPPPRTYCDLSLRQIDKINFNCGLRTRSVRMAVDTYLHLEAPTLVDISSQGC